MKKILLILILLLSSLCVKANDNNYNLFKAKFLNLNLPVSNVGFKIKEQDYMVAIANTVIIGSGIVTYKNNPVNPLRTTIYFLIPDVIITGILIYKRNKW